MKRLFSKITHCLAMVGLVLVSPVMIGICGAAIAQQDEAELDWPRIFENKDNKVIVYQPQIDQWKEHKILDARAAVVIETPDKKEVYGAIFFKVKTEVNHESRTVLLKDLDINNTIITGLDDSKTKKARLIVKDAIPRDRIMIVSLDRILAGLEKAQEQQKGIQLNLEPPPILYSNKPAILLGFFGDPTLEPVKGLNGISYVINTNWDILYEASSSTYFLLNGDSWMQSTDLLGDSWKPASKLPDAFNQLPADPNWSQVKDNLPGKKAAQVPAVFSSTQPSELIVVSGSPTLERIASTKLFYVLNTESDIFFNDGDKQFYFLTAGRWFSAPSLEGPWSEASTKLPKDFRKIPSDHEKGEVLFSIPGTPEAKVSVLLATIPHKATVEKKDVSVVVVYDGAPEFQTIEGTSKTVYYATNTANSVLNVDGKYYCVYNGVWFVSDFPKGPWVVAATVPSSIYSIPSHHPLHNVTYVYIYDTTPDTVVVGYTSGYSGSYVAATGVVMFGLGYWFGHNDDHYYGHSYYYPSHYYAYGGAARYSYNYGGYHRSASYYGPYGGVAGRSGYNSRTGTYYRGGIASGPYGSASARQAYNPYTNRSATQARANTPYGSWGRSAVSEGDRWARSGYNSNSQGTLAGIQTSQGSGAVGGYNRQTGNSGAVARNKYGDVYTSRNGDIYKHNNNTWNQTNSAATRPDTINRNYLGSQQLSRQYGNTRAQSFNRSGGQVRMRRR